MKWPKTSGKDDDARNVDGRFERKVTGGGGNRGVAVAEFRRAARKRGEREIIRQNH